MVRRGPLFTVDSLFLDDLENDEKERETVFREDNEKSSHSSFGVFEYRCSGFVSTRKPFRRSQFNICRRICCYFVNVWTPDSGRRTGPENKSTREFVFETLCPDFPFQQPTGQREILIRSIDQFDESWMSAVVFDDVNSWGAGFACRRSFFRVVSSSFQRILNQLSVVHRHRTDVQTAKRRTKFHSEWSSSWTDRSSSDSSSFL